MIRLDPRPAPSALMGALSPVIAFAFTLAAAAVKAGPDDYAAMFKAAM